MSWVKGAVKAGITMKILEVVRREAGKPQNQAKARQLIERLTSRASSARVGGRAPRSRFAGTRSAAGRSSGNRWTTDR